MHTISNQQFEGERPLFASTDLRLENVQILPGESAIKESSNIEAVNCEFSGKYPFWHVNGFTVSSCLFHPGARAALWYSSHLKMSDTVVNAPKMFRCMDDLVLNRVKLTDAQETLWFCKNITLNDVEAQHGDYIMMNSSNIRVKNFRLSGNYSFQSSKDIVVEDSLLDSKDAFWEAENIVVKNCTLNGEYLGWHSRNLKLINCHISGTQPLCYAEDLVLENCTFDPDCDLAFEYSSVKAEVNGHITSIKNPKTGMIKAKSIGEIILDKNLKAPGDCRIVVD